MKYFNTSYRTVLWIVLAIGSMMCFEQGTVFAQTPGGTQISGQASGSYGYKKKQFTVTSPIVTVTVANTPNFEVYYSVTDSNVIFKDVVQLWMNVKNVGNATADTVTIQSVLPSSGASIVSASGNGTISGNTITWKKFNDVASQKDSFLIQLRIDTTTLAQTILPVNGTVTWQGGSANAVQNLVVGNFARLTLTNTTTAPLVGSGRQLVYQIAVANTGNVQSDSTILVDTISTNGTFDHADVAPTTISSDKRIVTWFLGTLAAVSGRQTINVTVQTAPNLGYMKIRNSATVRSSNVPLIAAPTITTTVVPVRPAAMNLSLSQKYVFGAVNQDSAEVVATVLDSLGDPIPDGVPVVFSTTLGFFYGSNSITAVTSNGVASAYLEADNVNNVIQKATVTVTAGVVQTGTISGVTTVTMYPGAVTGVVRTSSLSGGVAKQVPYQGAIVKVFDNVPQVVGSDTTGSDGVFFIALNKQTITFTLQILIVDQFGDTSSTSTPVSSDTLFGKKAVKILNTISGRLQYSNGNTPIPIAGVAMYLDSLSPGHSSEVRRVKSARAPFIYSRIRTSITDNMGRYKFEGLEPAIYQVSVDSSEFPTLAGATTIYDTLGGTFTINLNIQVTPSNAAHMAMSATPTVFAGDTIRYAMHFQNQGNIVQTNVAMQDTLPLYTSFIAAQTGIFKSMTIDSTQRIVHWSMDTLAVSANDSVWMTLRVGRNVPDSTFIHNISWFGSSQLAFQSSETKTLVRSAPAMSLKNFIIDAKDSVIAGDSVKFEIWYQNVGTDSLRNVELVDSLFNAGRSILRYQNWSTGQPGKDTTVVDSIVTWKIGSVAPGSVDSLTLTMRTDYALLSGKTIQTTAYLVQNGVAVLSSSASVAVKSNPQFSTFLQVQKNADKNVAEIGDVVTYQVSVSNTSPGLMKSLTIIDQLPHSFKYYPHSGRYNNIPVDPQPLSGGAVLKWPLASIGRDSLNGGGTGVLVYQLVLGADALESQGINIAYATAKDASDTTRVFVSAPAQKQITVQPGVFTENGVIIGKVFYDDDRNAYQSEGETGIKGVEIWMEDGTRIVTGDDGKFSLPNVKAGQHVLRVNERSLPPGTELLKGGHDFAGDATSRFVRLPEGGIARANFFVKRVLRDSVHQRVGKVSKAAAMRTASPEKVYLQDVPAGASKTNIVEFGVHFNYSGGMWLQRILVFDDLPQGFSYVEGSALFNGRKVIPAIDGRHLLWSLGRGPSIFDGTLQYRVAVQRPEAQNSGLESHSVVELMTSDSVIIRSDTLTTTTSVQKISYVEKDFPVESLVFDPGKTSLRKNALAIFEPIVNLIKKYRYAEIMLVGYPDIPVKKDASLPSLQRLASERAKVALDFLSRRMKLDSVHIVPCGVFQCDTGKNVLETMMAGGSGSTIPPRHLEIRVQNYFLNALVERDTNTSMSAISLVRTLPESEKEFADSIFVIPGDDLLFSYALFSNPSSAVLGASVIDSTADKLSVESSSFTLNHIPIISAGEYKGVFSSSITPLIRKGSNVMQFEASIPSNSPNSQIEHTFYYERVNGFGETTIERSNPVTIYVRDKNLSLLNTALQRERTLAGTEGPPKSTTSK